jgi:hypothetical protein
VVLTGQVRANTAVGSATRADMVIRSYEQNFGRTPSQAELDLWTNRLLTGQYTDAQMVRDNQAYFKADTATQNGTIDAALYAVFGTNRAGVDWAVLGPEVTSASHGGPITSYQDLYNRLIGMVQPGGQQLAIRDAFQQVYGRAPTTKELAQFAGMKDANGALTNFSDIVANLTQQRTQQIDVEYNQLVGRAPTSQELAKWSQVLATGGKLDNNAYNAISPEFNPPEEAQTVVRAYVAVYNRYPSQSELNMWDAEPATYTGISTTLKNEADPTNPGGLHRSATGNAGSFTMPGGLTMTPQSNGSMNVTAQAGTNGTLDLPVAGAVIQITNSNGRLAAHVISNDGGSVVSNDGGSVVSNDGGSLISQDGSGLKMDNGADIRLISQDGSGLISQDGSGLISQDGSGLISQDGSGLISQDGSGLIMAAGVISNDGGSLISEKGNGVIGDNGAGLLSEGGGGLISEKGGGLINEGGAGLLTTGGPAIQGASLTGE